MLKVHGFMSVEHLRRYRRYCEDGGQLSLEFFVGQPLPTSVGGSQHYVPVSLDLTEVASVDFASDPWLVTFLDCGVGVPAVPDEGFLAGMKP